MTPQSTPRSRPVAASAPRWLLAAAIALLALSAAPALANPGRAVPDCIRAERVSHGYSDSMRFTNVCQVPVFVIYCGDTPSQGPFCQGGPTTNYYSHTLIVRPGASATAALQQNGRINWGACEGRIGSIRDGAFTDTINGHYTCVAR